MTIFDPKTFEESTVIYQVPVNIKWIDQSKPLSTQIDNNAEGYTLDTTTVYDPQTHQVIATKITLTLKD